MNTHGGKKVTHSIKYNFIMNFILTSSQFLFPLITFPYVSRVLLASGNGRIAFASSVANYFLMVASLGIPTYGVRACALVREDKEKLSKTVQELFLINAIMTTLVLAVYFIMLACVPRFAQERTLFYINGVNILLNCFGMNWLFQALEKYDYITIRSLLFKVVSIILMFCLVHETGDVAKYAAITVFAAVGSNICNLTQIHKYIHLKPCGHYDLKQHMKPIFILFSQSLVISIYTNLDTVMLGFVRKSSDVGLYNAAIKVKGILLSLVTSLGNVMLPRMSCYYKNGQMDEFKRLAAKAVNFTLFLSIPLCAYFILYAKESILFLSGEGYLDAVSAMQFLIFAVIANGLTGVLGMQVLTAEGKERYVLCSVTVGAIVDFALNCLLIPAFGASGAAFATAVAEYMVLVVQIFATKNLLQKIQSQMRWYRFAFAAVISAILSVGVKYIWHGGVFVALCLSAAVFFGIYGLIQLLWREPFVYELIDFLKKITRHQNKKQSEI